MHMRPHMERISRCARSRLDGRTSSTRESSAMVTRRFPSASRSASMAISGPTSLSSLKQSATVRSEEHTSELQSHLNLVCRLLLEKKKQKHKKETEEHNDTTDKSRMRYTVD